MIREGLIKEQTAEKNRNQDLEMKALKRISKRRLARLADEIEQLENLMIQTIEDDAELGHHFFLITSIKGVGKIAPLKQQSGKWSGPPAFKVGEPSSGTPCICQLFPQFATMLI